jgi:Na+/proline symporter
VLKFWPKATKIFWVAKLFWNKDHSVSLRQYFKRRFGEGIGHGVKL